MAATWQDRKYTVKCKTCSKERVVTRVQYWHITSPKGKGLGNCKSCAMLGNTKSKGFSPQASAAQKIAVTGNQWATGAPKGEGNGQWKGMEVGYSGLHHWVMRELGKPDTCEFCGTSGLTKQKINWANKSGNYLRDLTDWLRLCTKCHRRYDMNRKKLNFTGGQI